MSEVSNYKCDICGDVEMGAVYGEPTGWVDLSVTTEDEKCFWRREKDICCVCAENYGLNKVMEILSKAASMQDVKP